MQTGNNNSHLNRARVNKDDEFYTPRWYVERVFKQYKEFLYGKRLWLPCDGDDSEFTKVFKGEDDIWTKNTSNDYRENSALLDWCDVVVTNPPFSKLTDFFNFVLGGKKDYILIVPQNFLTRNNLFNEFMNKRLFLNWKQEHIMFNRPDGSQKEMAVYLISSFNKPRAPQGVYQDGVLWLKRWEDFVPTYHGKIAVPLTAAFQIDLEHYDILGKAHTNEFYERIIIQRKKDVQRLKDETSES